MRIAVIGAGAMGSLFAARFVAAGDEVRLVGRPGSVAAIRRDGITVEGRSPGRWPVPVEERLAPTPVPDLLVVAVKTFDLDRVAADLASVLPAPVPVVLPQNGLHVERGVGAALGAGGWAAPEAALVRAVNSIPAMIVAPGRVRQPGDGEIILAEPTGAAAAATRLARDAFRSAGLPVRTVPDLEVELWRKALVNAAINPVTAVHRVPNGRLLQPPLADEARALLREAQRAASAAGFPFSDRDADASLERVLRATAENRSSMLQDVERGRPTEIDAISGEILRTAAAHGIDLPATRAVLERLGRAPAAAAGRTQAS